MKIRVMNNWGEGYSRRVKPGEYDIDDPRLFGKGHYLVKNGHAIVIEEDMPAPETKPQKPAKKRRTARKITMPKGDK